MKVIKGGDFLDLNEVRSVDWMNGGPVLTDTPINPAGASPLSSRPESETDILRRTLATAETRHKEELAAKIDQARKEALAAYKKRDDEALAALSDTLRTASAEANDRLGTAEQLALQMCEAVLSKVFTNAASYKDRIASALRLQMEHLRSELILKVRVSKADFPDAPSLAKLRQTIGEQVALVQDSELEAGACRIELQLGHIDLSLPAHWDVLQAEFRRLGGAGAP